MAPSCDPTVSPDAVVCVSPLDAAPSASNKPFHAISARF